MNDSSLGARIKRSISAFLNANGTSSSSPIYVSYGSSYSNHRTRLRYGNERTIVNAIYNRIATDVSAVSIKHVLTDQNGRYKLTMPSEVNRCLSLNANKDQTGRDFIQDLVLSMFDEGIVAVVPVDTDDQPNDMNIVQIESLRTGKVVEWFPDKIKVRLYNDTTGLKEEVIVPKDCVAIITNPFYSVMNEQNSTLRRLVRKLALLDLTDEKNSSGKLDMIIQLPYAVNGDVKRRQAEQRRADLEMQLAGSKYGIAYTGSTERITQLNRPIENQLTTQVEYLTNTLYSQLGMTKEILEGTANEQTMLNYTNQVLEPILSAITDSFTWKFLTPEARDEGQSFMFFKDPFKLVPINNIADIADKFTRNEILSSNEVRGLVGMLPVADPRADELRNKNINQTSDAEQAPTANDSDYEEYNYYE